MKSSSLSQKAQDKYDAEQKKIDAFSDDFVFASMVTEVHDIAVMLSKHMKNNIAVDFVNKTQEEVIKQALTGSPSSFYTNAYESWSKMPDNIKTEVKNVAMNHFMNYSEKEDINSLVIAGGGGKGLIYPGAIKGLENEGALKNITTVAGASAGALTAIPLALGCNADELNKIVQGSDFRDFFIESYHFFHDTRVSIEQHLDAMDKLTILRATLANKHGVSVGDLPTKFTADRKLDGPLPANITSSEEIALVSATQAELYAGRLAKSQSLRTNGILTSNDLTASAVLNQIRLNAIKTSPFERDYVNKKPSLKVVIKESLGAKPESLKRRIAMNKGAHLKIMPKDINEFLGVKLSAPLKTDFLKVNSDLLLVELMSRPEIIKYAKEKMKYFNDLINPEQDYFKDPSQIISMSIRMTFSDYFIRDFIAEIVENKIHDFMGHHKKSELPNIKSLKSKSSYGELTMKELGQLAEFDRNHSNPYGLKDLVIAIASGNVLTVAMDSMVPLSPSKGKGVFISSTDHASSNEYDNVSIAEMARWSMSIPGVFESLKFNAMSITDGGTKNNLPLAYFDNKAEPKSFNSLIENSKGPVRNILNSWGTEAQRAKEYRRDNNILSIIPMTKNQINSADNVRDALYAGRSVKYRNSGSLIGFGKDAVKKIANVLKFRLLNPKGNIQYTQMDEKSDYRNIIIETDYYDTMSFMIPEEDKSELNNRSGESAKKVVNPGQTNSYNSSIKILKLSLDYDPEYFNNKSLSFKKAMASKVSEVMKDPKMARRVVDYFDGNRQP